MTLRADIVKQQTEALKSREELRLSVLRMLLSAIKNAEIDKKAELDDKEIQQIVARQIKQTKDAIKDFMAGGRNDLVLKNEAEIKILTEYLPEQMGEDDLMKIVKDTITELGVSDVSGVGKVMGAVMKKAQGQVDGNRVKEIVNQLLLEK